MMRFLKKLLSTCIFLVSHVLLFAQSNYKIFADANNTLQISAPANWTSVKSKSSLLLLKDPVNGKRQFDIDKMIFNNNPPTLDEFSKDQLSAFPNGKNNNGDILNNSGFVTSGGRRWWFVDYTSSKGTRYKCYQTIIGNEKYNFYYVCPAADFESGAGLAESALASFRFLNENVAAQQNNSTTASSDDRVNNTLPVITDKPLWTLKQATGWIKNKEGQWIEGKNKIQKYFMSVTDTTAWSKGINATGVDNFSSIEVRELTLGQQPFLMIIKVMDDGEYKYESMPDTWKPVKRVKYWVIKRNATTAKKVENNMNYSMKVYFRGYVPYDKDYLHKIGLDISSADTQVPDLKKFGSKERIDLEYKELADGKKSRFVLGVALAAAGLLTPYDAQPQYQEHIYPYIFFGDYYFECEKAQLAGFINLIEKK